MKIYVDRRYKLADYTIGKLYIDGRYFCDTLEDAVRPVKIPGKTAIPSGTYNINMNTVSPKFKKTTWATRYGGIVPRLENVPGFSGILIHPGNTPKDTDGCLLVGYNRIKGQVIESQKTWTELMSHYLWPAKLDGETITIEFR